MYILDPFQVLIENQGFDILWQIIGRIQRIRWDIFWHVLSPWWTKALLSDSFSVWFPCWIRPGCHGEKPAGKLQGRGQKRCYQKEKCHGTRTKNWKQWERELGREKKREKKERAINLYLSISISVWRENLHARKNNIRNNTWSTATNMIILVPLI